MVKSRFRQNVVPEASTDSMQVCFHQEPVNAEMRSQLIKTGEDCVCKRSIQGRAMMRLKQLSSSQEAVTHEIFDGVSDGIAKRIGAASMTAPDRSWLQRLMTFSTLRIR